MTTQSTNVLEGKARYPSCSSCIVPEMRSSDMVNCVIFKCVTSKFQVSSFHSHVEAHKAKGTCHGFLAALD